MEALIWIDWVIIALITVSTLISLKRGFVREALSLVTWVGAFILARTFHPQMQSLLESTVETPLVRLIAAFAILFFGTLIVGAIINNMIGHLIRATGLSATDRVLGMGFGLLRGVVVVIVAIALPVTHRWPRIPGGEPRSLSIAWRWLKTGPDGPWAMNLRAFLGLRLKTRRNRIPLQSRKAWNPRPCPANIQF